MFTSSFACTPSPASVAITSFAFMFEEVPEPVWNTSIGNWSSSSPLPIRSPAAAIRSAFSPSRSPSSAFARAAAALIRPSQRATGAGIGCPETGKLSTALRVSPPQSSCRDSVCAIASSVDGGAGSTPAPPVVQVLAVVAGELGHRVERVDLTIAVPRVVTGAALARLDGAAVRTGEAEIPVRQRRRAVLRIRRLLHVRSHLVRPHLAVLRG